MVQANTHNFLEKEKVDLCISYYSCQYMIETSVFIVFYQVYISISSSKINNKIDPSPWFENCLSCYLFSYSEVQYLKDNEIYISRTHFISIRISGSTFLWVYQNEIILCTNVFELTK